MPRAARVLCAGVPHHVTQRGNRRGSVFFERAHYLVYLHWLREYSAEYGVAVLAYCLMTNHVHHVLIPETKDGLPQLMGSLHTRFAQRVNRGNEWNGHLWQGRYHSSPLDQPHLWAAIRYVERNPVRAGMVARAEQYAWSSAAAHCGLRRDATLTQDPYWLGQFKGVGDWSAWLAVDDEQNALEALRKHASQNLPCGSQAFVDELENRTGRRLVARSQGRPTKKGTVTFLAVQKR